MSESLRSYCSIVLVLIGAAAEPKTFVTINGGDHNSAQSIEYYRKLEEFIDSLLNSGNSARPRRLAH